MSTDEYPFEMLAGPTIYVDASRAKGVLELMRCKNVDVCLREFEAYGVTKFFTDRTRTRSEGPCDPIEIRDAARHQPVPGYTCEHGTESGYVCRDCSLAAWGTVIVPTKPKVPFR